MFEISEAARQMLRDVIAVEGARIDEEEMILRLSAAYHRAHLAASPRLRITWKQLLSLYPTSPTALWGLEDQQLRVIPHLSYRTGTVTDFQAVTVTACAHAPACDRLTSASRCDSEVVRVDRFEAWLQDLAEAGTAAEHGKYDQPVEVNATVAGCDCLQGTVVYAPQLHPDQPEDHIWLVGNHLQHQYRDLFERWRFQVRAVDDIEAIETLKTHRREHLGVDEVCPCEPQHEEWAQCPVASADLAFECDRHCSTGCDWVMYPQHGHTWLAIHGTDIDLGPIEDDHTAALTERLVPDLRL